MNTDGLSLCSDSPFFGHAFSIVPCRQESLFMEIPFVKYQGTGNDFIIIDEIDQTYIDATEAHELVARMCSRRFGIGADGLMLLRPSSTADFEMVYFNADGKPSSMCGNGGRCIVHFAHQLGVCGPETSFMAVDGKHTARVEGGQVRLQMQNVSAVSRDGTAYVLDTGSPHYVQVADDDRHDDIVEFGRSVRYSETYLHDGVNVNVLSIGQGSSIRVSTYERGVEDRTLSCGTGVTACAIVAHQYEAVQPPLQIETDGGSLSVSFKEKDGKYTEVWLSGPATRVYQGVYSI